ncbi:TlpA family protein disulfide reductase [Aquimarina litoralis]|uniref:TlpA family protein disulfide reductase n=1 Tax=Aquimarina litoralis TaxID=584605 RepID=UPI001C579531|nr:TlpA disulfide reductase family protein [Aquimarina litoralis]MBW1298043.1 redoxin domain-containing protein [Aquimarina litoralis]
MKAQILFTLIIALVLTSCSEEKAKPIEYVIFSGKVLNKNADKLSVRGNDFSKKIDIQEDGTFADTLDITKNGYYSFSIGQEASSIYLKKGDDLALSIDTKEFDESIKYTGKAASANSYLANKYLVKEKFSETIGKRDSLNKSNPKDFKQKILSLKTDLSELLTGGKIVDTSFISDQLRYNNYDYLAYVNEYLNYNPAGSSKLDTVTSAILEKELMDIDLTNENDFKTSNAYRFLVSSSYGRDKRAQSSKDSIPYYEAFINGLSDVKNDYIRNSLMDEMTYYMSAGNPNSEKIYKSLMAKSTDTAFQNRITKSFNKIKLLAKGKDSPTFDYENYKGGSTSLADLKNHYVYIDVWATWCKPCIQEIPSLKKLEKEYDEKIKFVSISVDRKKDHDAWKTMIQEKELSGIQLFADNSWGSKFVQDYDIKGIPRFILIDTEGKIVNADAPRPSDPRLVELFKELKL